MELYLQSPEFIWTPCVQLYVLIDWDPASPLLSPHLGSYTRALLVSQDRRHLFVFPWLEAHFNHKRATRKTNVVVSLTRSFAFRSDAQRSAKQKERKERELEHCAFNAEHMEDGGFPLQMVSLAHAQFAELLRMRTCSNFCTYTIGPTFAHAQFQSLRSAGWIFVHAHLAQFLCMRSWPNFCACTLGRAFVQALQLLHMRSWPNFCACTVGPTFVHA